MSAIPLAWRQQIAERAHFRCSYCQSQQRLMGISLTIDHIIPQSLGGGTTLENLCLACWDCNLFKGDKTTSLDPQTRMPVRLFNPNQQHWFEHFRWNAEGSHIIGLTPVGRATISALKLNRPTLLEARRYWVQTGWHPPAQL